MGKRRKDGALDRAGKTRKEDSNGTEEVEEEKEEAVYC